MHKPRYHYKLLLISIGYWCATILNNITKQKYKFTISEPFTFSFFLSFSILRNCFLYNSDASFNRNIHSSRACCLRDSLFWTDSLKKKKKANFNVLYQYKRYTYRHLDSFVHFLQCGIDRDVIWVKMYDPNKIQHWNRRYLFFQ